jgi:hypothetical protein
VDTLPPVTAEVDTAVPRRHAVDLVVAGHALSVQTADDALAATLSDLLVDLKGGQDAGALPARVVRVDRVDPTWAPYPWRFWVDGMVRDPAFGDDAVVPYLLWEIVHGAAGSPDTVPVYGAAVARAGRTVALVGRGRGATAALTSGIVALGWGYVSDEIVLLSTASGTPTATPLWLPVVRPDVDVSPPVPLVPASSVGTLAPAAPLAAVVAVQHGPISQLRQESPAAVLVAATQQLAVTGGPARRAFTALAEICAAVPTYVIDLADAASALTLLDGIAEAS